jgi:predicted nucleotidyltransferase
MFSINQHKKKIDLLCETHKVDKLYLFGSATNETFNNESDIDLLVKFKSFDLKDYFINYLDLKEQLKKLFNREVDLVEEQTLKNPFLIKSINKNKSLIYGR